LNLKIEKLDNPLCFGTNEYSLKSQLCKSCRAFEECGEVNPRIKRKRKLKKNGYKIQKHIDL
jgi:hypothetical protein